MLPEKLKILYITGIYLLVAICPVCDLKFDNNDL